MATYKVRLVNEARGIDQTIDVNDDQYILEAAEAAGVDLPYSCRAGVCTSCCGKVVSGELDQSEGQALDDDQMGSGYALLCVAYPRTDMTIETDKEDEVI